MRWRAGVFALLILTAACSAEGPPRPARLGIAPGVQAGGATLRLKLDGLFVGRRQLLGVSATRARLTVAGPDLQAPFEREITLAAEVRVDAVPVGDRRLVTLQALDGAGQPIAGGRHRVMAALGAGDNDVAISPIATFMGDVFAEVMALDAKNGTSVATKVDLAALTQTLSGFPRALGVAHPALLDAVAVGAALHAGGGTGLVSQPAFAPAPGRLVLRPKNWPGGLTADVTLTDPVSAPMQLGDHPAVLAGLPAGTWTLTLTPTRPGLAPLVRTITVAAGATAEVELSFGTSVALPALPTPIGVAAYGVFDLAGQPTLVLAGGVARGVPTGEDAEEDPQDNTFHYGFRRFAQATGWAAGPDLPESSLAQVAVAHAGRLYLLGGDHVYRIDPASATPPQALPPLPVPADLTLYDPYPYPSYGAYPSDDPEASYPPTATPEPFDQASGPNPQASGLPSWWPSNVPTPNSSFTPAEPTALRFELASAVSLGDAIFVTGGDANGSQLRDVLRYDPVADALTVEQAENDRYHRYAMASAAAGGVWYLAGGADSVGGEYRPPSVTNLLTAYVPATANASGRWRRLTAMPTARGGAVAAVANGRIYVLGGHDALGRALNDVESYDPLTDTWQIHPPLTTRRAFAAAGVLGGKIVVAGGLDGFYQPFNAAPIASVEEVTP